jgi:hypothetical protein
MTLAEHDDLPPHSEGTITPEDESEPDSPVEGTYNDAHEVYGKIASTNFSILCGGFNGISSLMYITLVLS